MIILYGIPNCDTVKKARRWLECAGLAHRFHDFRKDGLDPARLDGWAGTVGWETLLNRSGTTFRKLPDAAKTELNAAKASALMLAEPAMIKRPVVEYPGGLLVGFKEGEWAARLR